MSGQKISRLSDHLSYWHSRFGMLVDTDFEHRLAEHGGMTAAQWRVLALLYHKEADSTTEIAASLAIDQPEASRLVARLEFKGLVARKIDPAAQHCPRLKLTRKGRQLTPKLAAAADANDRAYFASLSDDEIAQYKSLLAKLLDAHGAEPESE